VLDPDCLQVAGRKAQQHQDGRGDLGRLHRRADGPPVHQARQDDQDRHVAVLEIRAAVLGDLAFPAGVDDAVLDDADNVGMAPTGN
jgi:hypothetical protein